MSIILSVNGVKIDESHSLASVVGKTRARETIALRFWIRARKNNQRHFGRIQTIISKFLISNFKNNETNKIICTLGPASENRKILKEMVLAGMNVARLNMSHGTYDNHRKLIKTIREIEHETGKELRFFWICRGRKSASAKWEPRRGFGRRETYKFKIGEAKLKNGVIPLPNRELLGSLKVGERVLFDDGLIDGEISDIRKSVVCIQIKTAARFFRTRNESAGLKIKNFRADGKR